MRARSFRGKPENQPVVVTYMAERRRIAGVSMQTMNTVLRMRSYPALEGGGLITTRAKAERIAALLCCVVDDFARPVNEIDRAFLGTIRALLKEWGVISGEDVH